VKELFNRVLLLNFGQGLCHGYRWLDLLLAKEDIEVERKTPGK
jgi:hypothetical protein